jgi:hypothetical protein
MNRELPNDIAEFFRETGRRGGEVGGKRSLETMTPEERRERAKKAAAASAEARRNRERERLAASSGRPEGLRSQTPSVPVAILRGWRTKKEVLSFADQVMNGLHGYAGKKSRKRRDFYRNDLQWLADVLMRVAAGDRDPLRPTGQ